MWRWIACSLAMLLASPAFGENLVLVNGTIIDGSGNPRVRANLRIRDGKIADLGVFTPAASETKIDLKGMVIASGFINIHSHSMSGSQSARPDDRTAVMNGITTVVIGADGEGPVAIEDFMSPFDENPLAVNLALLIGQGSMRRHMLNDQFKRSGDAGDIGKLKEGIEFGMREGAFGVAVDLQSETGGAATMDELLGLASAIRPYGGVFLTSLRSESDQLPDAVKEAIEVGRRTKVPVEISDVHATGKAAQTALSLIDQARVQGVDVTMDAAAGNSDLAAFLKNRWTILADDNCSQILEHYVRDQKLLTLEAAVRKMSAIPAAKLGLKTRGVLKKGNAADIVVFDPAQPRTMKYVFVNGTVVVKDGAVTDARPGTALR